MSSLHLFGKRVRQIRLEQGLSQEQLALLSGLHRAYVGAIERGERNITFKNIEKVAEALKVPINELFKEM
jgi:transcriptional regulator with XRE-family HTH domain